MSKHVLTDASVTVNGTNLSTWVESVEINQEFEDVDLTAMGASAREHGKGLRTDGITVTFFQDYAASAVNAILQPLVSNTSGFAVVIKPTSGTVSSTNPSWTMTSLLFTYSPLAGGVGEANQTSVEFLPAAGGSIVYATT